MESTEVGYNSGKPRRTEVVYSKTNNQQETPNPTLFSTHHPQPITLPVYNLTHKHQVKKLPPQNKDSWLFQEEVEISHLKPEQILREAQNSNSSLTNLYNQIYRHPALTGALPTSLSRVNFSKAKIPKLTLTPAGVVSNQSQSTQSTQRILPRSGRRKFMPQTNIKVQRHQSLQMRGSDQITLPPLKRNSLLYSMKNKKVTEDFSPQTQMLTERYRTFYSSSYFTASSLYSPMREEEKNSFEILMKKHSISYQNNDLPETLPPLNKIQEITLPSHRKHHELEVIHDAEEPKESYSPLMISQSKQLRAQTNYEKKINEDIAPFFTKPEDENRSVNEYESPSSQALSPLTRRLTPIPPDTPLSLKRSIEKIKIVGFILPNGAQVKIKRELHPLLDIATDQRQSPRKYYSPTPQEDITYDTILLKETLEPIKNKQDLPTQKGDLVLLQKKLLESVPLGNIHNSLVELDPKHVRRDYLKSGGDITLATDLDGASTDSEQPNLIGPLYHKHHHHQNRGSNPMRIEQQRDPSSPPRTMYNTVTTLGARTVEEKQKYNTTFTLFKEIAERKKKKKLNKLQLPQSDQQTRSH